MSAGSQHVHFLFASLDQGISIKSKIQADQISTKELSLVILWNVEELAGPAGFRRTAHG